MYLHSVICDIALNFGYYPERTYNWAINLTVTQAKDCIFHPVRFAIKTRDLASQM